MTHLNDLLTGLRWWELQPDEKNTLLTEGVGSDGDRAVAALSSDRSFAVLYVPSSRDISVNLGQLAGPHIDAHWYDPAAGSIPTVSGSPFPASGSRRLRPATVTNSSGFEDWVLILKAGS